MKSYSLTEVKLLNPSFRPLAHNTSIQNHLLTLVPKNYINSLTLDGALPVRSEEDPDWERYVSWKERFVDTGIYDFKNNRMKGSVEKKADDFITMLGLPHSLYPASEREQLIAEIKEYNNEKSGRVNGRFYITKDNKGWCIVDNKTHKRLYKSVKADLLPIIKEIRACLRTGVNVEYFFSLDWES